MLPHQRLNCLQVHSSGFVYETAVTAADDFSYQWIRRSRDVRVLFVSTMHHYLNNMDRYDPLHLQMSAASSQAGALQPTGARFAGTRGCPAGTGSSTRW